MCHLGMLLTTYEAIKVQSFIYKNGATYRSARDKIQLNMSSLLAVSKEESSQIMTRLGSGTAD